MGKERIYTLTYADDIVVMADNEEGMVRFITGLEEYLDWKKVKINVEKTIIMSFRKRGERKKNRQEDRREEG